jgi:large conductance mechanosensitive channel
VFLQTVLDFIIIAFVIFMLVKQVNRLKTPAAASAPTTKDCPLCLSTIPIKATKCAHCTSSV